MHSWTYRRIWRKLHPVIDTGTQQIQAVMLSTNDFNDGQLPDDLLGQVVRAKKRSKLKNWKRDTGDHV